LKKLMSKKKKILIVIIAIVVLVVLRLLYSMVASDTERLYGNRLNGMSKVELSKSELKDLVSSLETTDGVKKASYDQKGRIYNFIIEVEEDADLDKITDLSSNIVDKMSDKQKEYFDIQVFITCDGDSNKVKEDFPIIGYRHKGSDAKFYWSNYKK